MDSPAQVDLISIYDALCLVPFHTSVLCEEIRWRRFILREVCRLVLMMVVSCRLKTYKPQDIL
jgi:hypothetical protein